MRNSSTVEVCRQFQIGDSVSFHGICGGPVSSTGHTITSIEFKPNNFGEDVAWITGKSGCVSLKALSKANVGNEFAASAV